MEARSADERTVTLSLLSHCPVLEQLAETLRQASPVDAYEEAGDPGGSLVLQAVGRLLLECPACRVGVDVYRALYSASGLLL